MTNEPTASDLAAYSGLLYAIAAEAVEKSVQPIGGSHREVKQQVTAFLKTAAAIEMDKAKNKRKK